MPPSLRFLKWLVILLTLTMIGGVITVVAVLVTRMPQLGGDPALPDLPATLALPPGAKAEAVTFGRDWTAVVTEDQRIIVFDQNGIIVREISLVTPPPP